MFLKFLLRLSFITLGSFLTLTNGATRTCDSRQMMRGYRIVGRDCVEAYGCRSEIHYQSRHECHHALRAYEQYPCDPIQVRRGYKIEDNQSCEEIRACKADLPFLTRAECNLELKELKKNSCSDSQRCRNGGNCIQTSNDPYFKCKCEGTGFYGRRCESACPTSERIALGVKNPYECILI